MKKTNELICALTNASDNPGVFLSYTSHHKAKNDPFDLKELLQVFTKKDLSRLWEAASVTVRKSLEKIESVTNEMTDEEANGLLELLDGVLIMVNCYLTLDTVHIVKELHQALVDLHDSLLAIPDVDIQDQISLACEKWWNKDWSDKNFLVANTITYLITRSVSDQATVSVVKRLYAMKSAMQELDFDDPSSEPLKTVLLQCFVTPIILKADQGRKFLSSLFWLSSSYTVDIHEAIKTLMLHCPTQHLTWYGDIYFDAWKNATEPFVEVIENQCLQDLMYCAVHAPRKGLRSMFHSLRYLLSSFHKHVSQHNVITMLVRLYGPFLWRSLKVANADVRTNATTLLFDVFPLQDHYQNKQDQEEALQRQFTIMKELLEDPSVSVRVAAITGVCKVLAYYWELIPASVIKSFLTKLIVELCRDASSDNVRVSVLQGLCAIMDNVLSIPVMKELLPLLHHCIHDTSEKVRIAFCELLLVVKGIKSIKFWNVCSMENLMARMECDTPHVAKRIVALVIDSFQGTKIDLTKQVDRCIYLLETYPEAARRFYQLAQAHLPAVNAARLILAINQFLIQVIEHGSDTPSCQQQNGDGGTENESISTVSMNNTAVICGLLETMVILWEGSREKFNKPACKAIKKQLISEIAESHSKFYASFPGNSCQAAIFILTSHLPKRHVKIPMDVSKLPREQAIAMLLALTSWKQIDAVLKQVSNWLDSTITVGGALTSVQAPPKRRSKKTKTTSVEPAAAKEGGANPQVALEQLQWLMTYPTSCKAVKSSKLFHSLQQCLQRSMPNWELLSSFSRSLLLVSASTSETSHVKIGYRWIVDFDVAVLRGKHIVYRHESDWPDEQKATGKSIIKWLNKHSYTSSFLLHRKDLIEQRCTNVTSDISVAMDTTLVQMFAVYVKMLMHGCLETSDVNNFNQFMESIWHWFEQVLLPATDQSPGMGARQTRKRAKRQTSTISLEVVKTFLLLLSEMLLIGLANKTDLCDLIGRILIGVADKSVVREVWPSLCKLLYQLTESCSIQEEGLMKTTVLMPLPPALEKILAIMLTTTDIIQYNKMFATLRPCLALIIVDSVKLASYFSTRLNHDQLPIFTLFKALLQSIGDHVKATVGYRLATTMDELPRQPASLLGLLCNSIINTRLLLHHIIKLLEAGISEDNVMQLISILHLLPSLLKHRTARIVEGIKEVLLLIEESLQPAAGDQSRDKDVNLSHDARELLVEVREKIYRSE